VSDEKVRIDKWLWAARFFKTRALATAAVNGGKVHSEGQRVRPSRAVKINDIYDIQRGFERYQVVVQELSERRGPAKVAQTLYLETESSIQKRGKEAEQRKLAQMQRPVFDHRPNKKERRKIRDLTGKG
jgi:ribosome-associated heat shock protein Hsp15